MIQMPRRAVQLTLVWGRHEQPPAEQDSREHVCKAPHRSGECTMARDVPRNGARTCPRSDATERVGVLILPGRLLADVKEQLRLLGVL